MNKMYLGLVCLLVLPSMGCLARSQTPIPCDQIVDPRLHAAPFSSSGSEFGRWIKSNYQVGDIHDVGDGPRFDWKSGDKEYIAPDTQRILADLSPKPTINEVITCYGIPEAYSLEKLEAPDNQGIQLSLWYASQGMLFTYTKYAPYPTSFDSNSILNQVLVFHPGSKESVLERLTEMKYRTPETQALKEWPQPFRKIDLLNETKK